MRSARLIIAATSGVLLLALCGCESGGLSLNMDEGLQNLFKPRRTPQQYILIAVSDADPDMRREAAVKVAESKKYNEEWAIKGFMAIAALEDDPQTRCIAIRGLARSRDPRGAETFLKILNAKDYPPQEVRSADDLSRWDTTSALADFAGECLPEELQDKTRETFIALLKSDTNRNVRTNAARGLQYFSHSDAVDSLINGLRDTDFTVAYQCEMSLAYLTGVTNGCDAYAWQQWRDAHGNDLFAQGGTLPPELQKPYKGRLGQMAYDTKRAWQWLFPGKKGE